MKIGLIGVGLNTYWGQFDGLLERLMGYQKRIKDKILSSNQDVEVVDAGMIDNTDKSHEAVLLLKKEDVELLFIFVSTYALSSTLIPLVNSLKIPIILLNLSPSPFVDYNLINSMNDRGKMTGEWLANCQACSIPEFASVFNRSKTRYDIISGYLDDNEAWKEINEWIIAAKVFSFLRQLLQQLSIH